MGGAMQLYPMPADSLPVLTDRRLAEAALELIAAHGPQALPHVTARARESRDVGNVVNFCRFRQIERLIAALQCADPAGEAGQVQ